MHNPLFSSEKEKTIETGNTKTVSWNRRLSQIKVSGFETASDNVAENLLITYTKKEQGVCLDK